MLEFVKDIDRSVFLMLNDLHHPVLDSIMYVITNQWAWIPLFAFVIYMLFKSYRKDAWWLLLGIALVILFSDQLVSGFMKPFFGRIRPSHDPDMEGLIHIVNEYRGGLYSFASSHAANSFGVAFFLWVAAKDRIPWIWIMFLWASIFSYTRIYLGVHYPGDILMGALVGTVIGYMISEIIQIIRSRIPRSE